MWVTSHILNTALDTLETRNIRCHSLVCQTTGSSTNSNSTHKSNFFYPSKIMSKFSIIFRVCLIRVIYCQCKFRHQLLFMCRVCTKRCINVYKFSSWEPFIYQLHDMITLINTETKRILDNPKMQVLNDRSFLEFNLKIIFKNSSQFKKFCLVISMVDDIASIKCKQDTVP